MPADGTPGIQDEWKRPEDREVPREVLNSLRLKAELADEVRPGIVISGTAHNDVLHTAVVVPTSSIAPEIRPLRLAVGNFAGKPSYAVIPGLRQVRRGPLRGTLGQDLHGSVWKNAVHGLARPDTCATVAPALPTLAQP